MENVNDTGRILVGTSGFAYKEWKGSFYPEKLPAKKYLSYYAEHFPTTEINNTFYRMPTAKLCEGWYAEVPENFSFTLKLSQRITHFKRLKNVDDEMSFFLDSAARRLPSCAHQKLKRACTWIWRAGDVLMAVPKSLDSMVVRMPMKFVRFSAFNMSTRSSTLLCRPTGIDFANEKSRLR